MADNGKKPDAIISCDLSESEYPQGRNKTTNNVL
jgi:hypothetical protein